MRRIILTVLVLAAPPCPAADPPGFDAAAAFGARPSARDLVLSPDGQKVAWIAPTKGPGSVVYTMSLTPGAKAHATLQSDGRPDRVYGCSWVSNERLVCTIGLLRKDPTYGILPYSRIVAVNADGSNVQMLSNKPTSEVRGQVLYGGTIIDWLPDADSSVLMARENLATDHAGTRLASSDIGLGVDQVDTRTLKSQGVEKPRRDAWEYITDGRGHVRIIGFGEYNGRNRQTGTISYSYHPAGSTELQSLGTYRYTDSTGFDPARVDPDLNVAYGFKKLAGRFAVYAVGLDGARNEQLVYANPDVDVESLLSIGPRNRVVGATYVTDYRHTVYFAPEILQIHEALRKALRASPNIVESSADENRLLVQTITDVDPGVYYIFDRKTSQLQTFLVVRAQLEGVKLASQRPITYAAADGVQVPAYLTLPPGTDSLKGLPAIVLPHSSTYSRDRWGFNWVAQFFANRGYAVLQPNFRGSAGYGDAWFANHGFKSWKIAIGDILDGGRWLVQEGADPAHLGIVGWSYGGYAALQSAVQDPALFRAVVAIAPITDLDALKEERRHWTNFEVVSSEIGEGPHVREGSPAQHADRIKVPVLLFHGDMDSEISSEQSRLMDSRLKSAGVQSTLVTWDDLDQSLEDGSARAELLRRSDEFLRKAFGM